MITRTWLRLAGLALGGLVAGGCGSGTVTPGGTTTGGAECSALADCAAGGDECRVAVACDDGVCVFEEQPDGTPLMEQTAGDCAELVCDGAGEVKAVPLAGDLPDDGNACTVDACDGATPTHTPQRSMPCYSGPPETLGKGICTAGILECDPAGNPVGVCQLEVLPAEETCLSPLDDDCDGEVDESGADCTCGDGTISNAEQCDDGGATALCDEDCTPPVCGDGLANAAAGEPCDDGNTSPSDGCDSACQFEELLAMVGGFNHTCALLSGGIVKCWGNNIHGQLGLGDTETRGDAPGEMGASLPPVDLGAGAVVTALAAGDQHTCALLVGGVVKCWGNGFFGQLGLGDTEPRGDEAGEMGDALPPVDLGPGLTATAISASGLHTCALLSNGAVKCWGYDALGQLGLGTTAWVGDEPGELAASPGVDLGQGVVAVAVATSYDHSCALLSGGAVKCWGDNASGQLGLGDTLSRGDEPGEMGDALPAAQLGPGVTAVSITAGYATTCALLSSGAVKCWGLNNGGQLGLGDIQNRGDASGEMGDALLAVDLGQGVTALSVVAAHDHVCALLSSGAVKCWGSNDHGHLGQGDLVWRGNEPGEMGDALPAVDLGPGAVPSALHGGEYHTCSILGARMKCWGNNLAGQLGLGDVEDRGDAPGDMGDALPFVRLFNAAW